MPGIYRIQIMSNEDLERKRMNDLLDALLTKYEEQAKKINRLEKKVERLERIIKPRPVEDKNNAEQN